MIAIRGLSITLILVVLVQVHGGLVENASGRIINGNTATEHFQYHAHLIVERVGELPRVGSGIVISRSLILTSAQNIYSFDNFRAGVGSVERESLLWFNALLGTHLPSFDPDTLVDNIGFLIFAPGTFNIVGVTPISLPDASFGDDLPYENEQGRVTGFGHTSNGADFALYVQYAFKRVVNDNECQTTYPNHNLEYNFCAYDSQNHGKICGGDQGGAFITMVNGREYLTGLSSYVLETDCIRDRPALFVRLLRYRDAIELLAGLFN